MAKKFTWIQVAEILGVRDRHLRRWRDKYEQFGFYALFDGRCGQKSPRSAPVAIVEEVLMLYQEHYCDFNAEHVHEKLTSEHGIELSYTWTKGVPQGAGPVKGAPKRSTHYRRRPR